MSTVKITLKINDENKEFIKADFTLYDNLQALKHRIKEENYYAKDQTADGYEHIQHDFADTIVNIFGNRFTRDELLHGLSISNAAILDEIYLKALGGEEKDKDADPDNGKK
ncbi:phage tail assembly chaperone G [Enterococcus rotai]|uniref:phage tail assembly chaperone G n=1 Tax=Enterococcus rotai TaxID=118060 RepID=UPI0035C76089